MPPNPILRCDELIKLVEEQKRSFTEEFRTLTPREEARRTKADVLISKELKGLNDKQRKARTILRNLKLNVGYEVFLLCALATTPTGLGVSQLGDYIGILSKWWATTDHPDGLRLVASRKYDEFSDLATELLPAQTDRQIDYTGSGALVNLMPLLGDPLFDAVSASKQWKWERSVGGLTTDCMNAIVPEDPSQDISITLSVGHKMGLDLIRKFKLTPT